MASGKVEIGSRKKVIASVTGDGVLTYKQVLNSLYSQISGQEGLENSNYETVLPSGTIMRYTLLQVGTDNVIYLWLNYSSEQLSSYRMVVSSDSSYQSIVNGTYEDKSENKFPAGRIARIVI